MLDISDLDPAEVLAALYNASRPLGLGRLHFTPEEMTRDEASALLLQTKRFDYLKGRVLKVDFYDSSRPSHERNQPGQLQGDALYDRDNGEGAALSAISMLREKRAVGQ